MLMTEKQSLLKNNPQDAPKLEKEQVKKPVPQQKEGETGGAGGPEPTRFGDWEKGGRCTDF